jgi:hypothetical protein
MRLIFPAHRGKLLRLYSQYFFKNFKDDEAGRRCVFNPFLRSHWQFS